MSNGGVSTLRVMSFNIRGYYHQDGVNAWPNRRELNIATIRDCAPDLLGVQEAHGGNLRDYHDALANYHYVAWPYYDNRPPHGRVPIYWHPSRLRPVGMDGFWLSKTPLEFSRAWDTANPRCATWIEFEIIEKGARIVHLNTHLDHVSEVARVEGTKLVLNVLDELQSAGAAAVVTGDFNARVGSPAYALFVDAGFRDTYVEAGNDDDPGVAFTYHGWEGDAFRGSDDPPRRIDWILLRDGETTKMRTVACEIVRKAEPPVYPSDHFPVIAEIAVSD